MNLPNQLTVSRIVLTFFFLYFISLPGLAPTIWASVIFTVASLTDFLDGYLAKKYNQISNFGKLMDPIADKFLMLAAFLAFVRLHVIADWMVVMILGREIIVTGLRFFALSRGKVLAAERAGKHKTVSQVVAVFAVLGFLMVKEIGLSQGAWTPHTEAFGRCAIDFIMLVTVALTLVSGISYLFKNRNLFYGA